MSLEQDQLNLAARHLAEAGVRIAGQRRLIRRLREEGYPTELAEQLLGLFLDTEDQMRRHRDELEARAARP